MRVIWVTGRSHQSILKEINPEYSLYFGYLMGRADSLEKILVLENIEGKKRRGQQRMRRIDSLTDSMDANLRKLQETGEERGA